MNAAWTTSPATGLEKQIADFKATLPGWWFSVCECQVSCDASCGPTREAAGFDMLLASGDDRFNSGFHADLLQPDSLAGALWCVMFDALVAIDEAQGIEARQGQDAKRLDPKDESPVTK